MTKRKDGPRPVVIGTCALSGRGVKSADVRLADGLAMIDKMAHEAERQGWGLDIVALPEHFALVDGSAPQASAESLDGRTVSAMAEKARAYGTYAVVSLYLAEGGAFYNSAVLLDRRGEPIGVYHKVFPVVMPDGTVEQGITPGSEFPVWDLDIGRVGMQVCFDAAYEDGWQALAAEEAELVVFPSAAPCIAAIISYASRFGYYVAGAIYRPPGFIVDPLGAVIARADADREVAVARVDLDYRIVPSRFLWTRGDELKRKYGDRVDYGWHDAEGSCIMTSTDPGLPVGRFIEAEGIETMPDWLACNRQAQDKARGRRLTMPPKVKGR